MRKDVEIRTAQRFMRAGNNLGYSPLRKIWIEMDLYQKQAIVAEALFRTGIVVWMES